MSALAVTGSLKKVSPRVPRGVRKWLAALSAYWFASSFKWFILLVVVLPTQVENIVPAEKRSSAWGMVFGLGAIWAVVGPSVFGYWSDRLATRKRFILWGGILTVIALGVLASASTLLQLSLGYLLLQVSDDVGTGPYDAVIPDLVPKRIRGLASGFVNLASLTGQVTVGVAAILLRENVIAVYSLIACVTVVGAMVTYYAIAQTKERGHMKVGPQVPFFSGLAKGWLEPWKHPNFVWVWLTRFLFALGLYLVQPYLKFYISDTVPSFVLFGKDIGGAAAATSLMVLTISVAGAASALYGGRASDRYGRKRVVFLAGASMSLVIIFLLTLHDLRLLLMAALFFGAGYGAYLSASMAMAVDALPSTETHGKDMGIWQMSNSSVQIIAGSAGLIVDYGNSLRPRFGYQIVFGLAGCIFALGTFLVKMVRDTGLAKDNG